MKRLTHLGVLLLAVIAASSAAAETIVLPFAATRTVSMRGTTAAWAVDSTIVEVTVTGGSLTLRARGAGRTNVIVVHEGGQSSLEVTVEAQERRASLADAIESERGTADLRYRSAAGEVQAAVSMVREDGKKRTEIEARTVHYTQRPAGERATTSIASASLRFFGAGRELTLLDRDVDHSPLTLSHVPIRGAHYLDDTWRLHAGVASYAAYGSFLIPVERELVAGAGYAIRTGPRSKVTPGVFFFSSEGAVASLLYEYSDSARLDIRSEVGYSNGLGGAAQVRYATPRDQVHLDVRYRPDEFAGLQFGSAHGFQGDAAWSRQYGRRSVASFVLAASDIADTRVHAASLDLEHRIHDRVALTGGASWGRFGSHSTLTVPLGARYEFARGHVGALYRYAQSASNRGGHGFRINGRLSRGAFSGSAFVDRQQNAPTLEAIYDELPDLASTLAEMGLGVTTPADLARVLRENATLVELGYIDGVTVDLAPLRSQVGFELAWLGRGASRQQLRARAIHSVTETVAGRAATTIASLHYSRRLTRTTDLFASYSWWTSERRGIPVRNQPSFELGLRRQFSAFPSFGGSGDITVSVFLDDDLDGRADGTPLVAEVDVDGKQRMRTDARGTAVFTKIDGGVHRVTVRVPDHPTAYFTSPSRVDARAGDELSFGVALSPARASGVLRSDAGKGIAGVRVRLERGSRQLESETKSDGSFSFAAAPGQWTLSLVDTTVPLGYAMSAASQTLLLDRANPVTCELTLRAQRSIAGEGARPNSELRVEPVGKTIRADAQGRFVVRSLPAGEITLLADGKPRRVSIPLEPGIVRLDLGSAQVATLHPVQASSTQVTDRFVVALGAYRVRANALDTVKRARTTGLPVSLDERKPLILVHAGPFATRRAATSAADALASLGIETRVMLSAN
jgi:hypothetical protein